MASILTVKDVEKSFGARRVLNRASFTVGDCDRIGLVGLNGAGKSTLLRMLVAASDEPAYQPDAGIISRARDLTIEYLEQEPTLSATLTIEATLREGLRAHASALAALTDLERTIPSLTGSELSRALERQSTLHHRIEHLGGWDQDHELRGVAAALDLPPLDSMVGRLSGGERRRVALGRALLARPALLALDEPTNHLDAATVEWLEERLRTFSGALLLVTHDRYFLDRVATRILELDRGEAYLYEGGYSRFLELQAARLAEETERERARKAFVRRELDWIRRGPAARTTKQQARIDRFDAAVAAAPTSADRPPDRMQLRLPMAGRLGKTILELRGLAKRIGERRLFSGLDLVMKPGDRIGIVGGNGVGKTTLIRTILGELPADEGEVVLGQNTRFCYLDQARADLDPERTVLEEVADGEDYVVLEDGPIHVRTFLRMMLFDDGFANTPIGTLSGGERNRVQLARLLRRGGNVLVLDEPTNDLDLVTLGVLEEALAEYPGCALVVSHDRWFLDKVATGILAYETDPAAPDGPGRFVLHAGGYSDYLARRGVAASEGGGPAPASAARGGGAKAGTRESASPPPGDDVIGVTSSATAATRKLTFKEKRELEGMEAAILEAEARRDELRATVDDPAIYKTRAAEVPSLLRALEQASAEVDRLYARWQELGELA